MSGQPPRVRRNASPGSTKQGPLRATVPVSLMRQGSPNRSSLLRSSPSNSPTMTWPCDGSKAKNRKSPDHRMSPERRSPGSPSLKAEKSKTLNLKSNVSSRIRRTASLDAIYLKGQWPKDVFRTYCGTLLIDKSTQTPEEWNELLDKKKGPHKRSNSVGTGDQIDKFIRTRLQRNKEGNRQTTANGQRHSPVHGDHSAISVIAPNAVLQQQPFQSSRPIQIPNIPKPLIPRMRNSVEGLNQEIERLVLKGISGNEEDLERIQEPTPDGHRAPIADLLRTTRTVNTQTPSSAGGGGGDDSSQSSGPASRCHSMSPPVPIILGTMDSPRSSSQIETDSQCLDSNRLGKEFKASPSPELEPKLGTSPHNRFLSREPPDGCERVKIAEETRRVTIMPEPICHLKPRDSFILQPSQGSAFCPLRKSYLPTSTPEIAVKSPASQTNQTATIEGQ